MSERDKYDEMARELDLHSICECDYDHDERGLLDCHKCLADALRKVAAEARAEYTKAMTIAARMEGAAEMRERAATCDLGLIEHGTLRARAQAAIRALPLIKEEK